VSIRAPSRIPINRPLIALLRRRFRRLLFHSRLPCCQDRKAICKGLANAHISISAISIQQYAHQMRESGRRNPHLPMLPNAVYDREFCGNAHVGADAPHRHDKHHEGARSHQCGNGKRNVTVFAGHFLDPTSRRKSQLDDHSEEACDPKCTANIRFESSNNLASGRSCGQSHKNGYSAPRKVLPESEADFVAVLFGARVWPRGERWGL